MQQIARFVHSSKSKKVRLLFTKSVHLVLATGRRRMKGFKSMRTQQCIAKPLVTKGGMKAKTNLSMC